MICLDTKEEVSLDWFLNALENGEIIIDGRHLTEEDHDEISRQIAECKALRKEEEAKKELEFATA